MCVFPRKEEGHLLPVAEPARHLDKSHAGPRSQHELPARWSRGQTFAPPSRRLSRPHWPLRPGVLHEKQKRPRLRHPSCCLIAHLEIRCSETQETKGSEGRACAFRAGTWAPWLYRTLAAGLWARFPSKAHVLTYKGRDARRTGSGGVETRLDKTCRVTAESETAFPEV